MKTDLKKLELDVFFNRNSTSPIIPNKIAQIKDYLSIHSAQYYNSVKFVGGYNIKNQAQSVANFVIFTNNIKGIKDQFLTIFKDQDVYISIDSKIPKLI
tara:strand:- start:463 stop:759 length:297 start_codon:yes stop_codon:yes gene_type:complete